MGIKKSQVAKLPGGNSVQAIEGWTPTDFYSAPAAANFQFTKPFTIGQLMYVNNTRNGIDGSYSINIGSWGGFDGSGPYEGFQTFLYDAYGSEIFTMYGFAGGTLADQLEIEVPPYASLQTSTPAASGQLVYLIHSVNLVIDDPAVGRPPNTWHAWLNGKMAPYGQYPNSGYVVTYDPTITPGAGRDIAVGANPIDTANYPHAAAGMGMLGMFYTNQALSREQCQALTRGARQANDMVDLSSPILDYWWTARDNPGANWASRGTQTSFDLVRTGAPLTLVESARSWAG